jgi:hypothetical protein
VSGEERSAVEGEVGGWPAAGRGAAGGGEGGPSIEIEGGRAEALSLDYAAVGLPSPFCARLPFGFVGVILVVVVVVVAVVCTVTVDVVVVVVVVVVAVVVVVVTVIRVVIFVLEVEAVVVV